ncbi:GM13827 [Drosophila sechellia]|uniref:GM13827 n=1 Tax=Drosophila sechellia TaxID=7238 RepID=B4HUW8_DROSE|nr:GM13827 [Drosophila sechellia]
MMAVAAAQKNREMFAIKKSYSIENGYPSRRRSLVDDARFETLVVKQTKQTVLEEARSKANDDSVEDCIVQAQEHIPSEQDVELQDEHANLENLPLEEYVPVEEDVEFESVEQEQSQEQEPEGNQQPTKNDYGLTEDEILLANAASESSEAEAAMQSAALVVRLKEGISSLGRILKAIETFHGTVQHVESRQSRMEGVDHDVLIKLDMTRGNLLQLIRSLRQSGSFSSMNLMADNNLNVKAPWFPQARLRVGQLQPSDDQVRARSGHEPPRIRRQGLPPASQGDRRDRLRLQVRRPDPIHRLLRCGGQDLALGLQDRAGSGSQARLCRVPGRLPEAPG